MKIFKQSKRLMRFVWLGVVVFSIFLFYQLIIVGRAGYYQIESVSSYENVSCTQLNKSFEFVEIECIEDSETNKNYLESVGISIHHKYLTNNSISSTLIAVKLNQHESLQFIINNERFFLFFFYLVLVCSVAYYCTQIGVKSVFQQKLKKMFEPLSNLSLDQLGEQKLNYLLEEYPEIFPAFERIKEQAKRQKEFSADMAHEIRTPLSVMRRKSEQIADRAIETKDSQILENVDEILAQVDHASNIIKVILELSKGFENAEKGFEEINALEQIQKILKEDFSDNNQTIRIEVKDIDSNINFMYNYEVFDLIIVHLITNSLKHAEKFVEISCNENEIIIVNDCSAEVSEQIFERHKKFDLKSDSYGIGLSIVRKLSKLYNSELLFEVDKVKKLITFRFVIRKSVR
jgi:signal transduction histidine kinase